jgi:DNA-binding transcriptional LysR family regulator
MALAGLGIAWLPESLAAPDLESGALVPAAPAGWRLDLDIALVRRAGDGRELVDRAAAVLAELIDVEPHANPA